MSTLETVELPTVEVSTGELTTITPKSKTFAQDLVVYQANLSEAVRLEKTTVDMINPHIKTINTARSKIIESYKDKVSVARKALNYHEGQVKDRMKKLRTSRKSKSPHTLFFMDPDEYILGTSRGEQCLYFIARKRPDNATYNWSTEWDRAYYWGIETSAMTRLKKVKTITHEDFTQDIWREIFDGSFKGNSTPYLFQPVIGASWSLSKTEIANLRAFKVEDFKDLDLLTDEEIKMYSDISITDNPHYTQAMR